MTITLNPLGDVVVCESDLLAIVTNGKK